MFSLPLFALLAAPAADPPKPFDINDWTPRPAVGKAEPWERAGDKDWIDARFRATDTGPFLGCTLRFPYGREQLLATKAVAMKVGANAEAAVAYDRNTLQLAAGWAGGYLLHSDRRFGLMNTPTPVGTMVFATPAAPAWGAATPAPGGRYTAPAAPETARYGGLYRHGDRVTFAVKVGAVDVRESPWAETVGTTTAISLTVEVGPGGAVSRRVLPAAGAVALVSRGRRPYFVIPQGKTFLCVAAVGDAPLQKAADSLALGFAAGDAKRRAKVLFASVPVGGEAAFAKLLDASVMPDAAAKPAAAPPKPIVTTLVRGGDAGPFAVDTLTIPYANPAKALFFCTGLDFLPDGRVAMCTCHGDVWLAKPDDAAGTVTWTRFASGLYQPLGLKVVAGKIHVLERGQLTRLHDANADSEANFYENVNNDWHCGGGEHSYDTCLETDPAGNFYFFKTGDTDTPHGGCLMKVSADGRKCEVFATGFRHPIGMGMSPGGVLTGADQEGNWMPATRIDEYKPGGFYGDMRAHHRVTPPATFDPPLCWLPREVDNSAGGDAWVPANAWGPFAGLPLHFSYGRCKAFLLLRQEYPGGVQGGVADLGIRFLSGVCRGRFHPTDGHLYACGLNGWQTAAEADGCLQRVRYTGKPLDIPVKHEVVPDGVKLTFARPLDGKAATTAANYRAAAWNYRYSGEYGSKRWKPSAPAIEGQDDFAVREVTLSADGRTVLVKLPGLRPVMQLQIGYNVAAADAAPATGSVYLTVHSTGGK